MKKILVYLPVFLLLSFSLPAQDDLLSLLEQTDSVSPPQWTTSTFKGTRLINGHTVETRDKNVLDLIISHRFGRINTGPYEFFGLDEANVRIGVDYGLANNLNIGIGRNSFEKTFDGFLKYRFINQAPEKGGLPFTAVLFTSVALNSLRTLPEELPFTARLAYTWQVLIARKFNQNLSLQIAPVLVHKNMAERGAQSNENFAIGMGGRYKITKRLSLNAEYYYRINPSNHQTLYNSLSIGFDIETGGHVFQLHFSNSRAMMEKGFITETTGDFLTGDIHFGFNISRVFQLNQGKKESPGY